MEGKEKAGDFMRKLESYKRLEKEIHEFFGYVEDWCVIPLEDSTDMHWRIEGGDDRGAGGNVIFHKNRDIVADPDNDGDYYQDEIYTQRFLPKWVYRADGYTMVCCDTHTDGNKFLRVFDNEKEVKL